MRLAMGTLVVLSLCLTVAFVLRLGRPWRSENPVGAWLWATMSWATAALDVLLLLALLRIPVSPYAGLAVLLFQDGVYSWRLFMLEKTRSGETREVRR